MWRSKFEHSISAMQTEAVLALQRTDDSLGSACGEKYGAAHEYIAWTRRRSIAQLSSSARQMISRLLAKPSRALMRRLESRLLERQTLASGAEFMSSGMHFRVLYLGEPKLYKLICESNSDFIVLTRTEHCLFKSKIRKLGYTLKSSPAHLWFGATKPPRGKAASRPLFSHLLLRQTDFLGPVIVVRTNILKSFNFLEELTPDLWFAFIGLNLNPEFVENIPTVLGADQTQISEEREDFADLSTASRADLFRRGIAADVIAAGPARWHVNYPIEGEPLVSIIIPTKGAKDGETVFVIQALESIVTKSTYKNLEFIVVVDDETSQDVINFLETVPYPLSLIRWSEPFNFSRIMNFGSVCSNGEFLLFLNDDIEIVSPDWVERMLSLIGVDEIAYVGALLFFEDQTIQHAGHTYNGAPSHEGFGEMLDLMNSSQLFSFDRICAGVTAACSLVPRDVFFSVGGFSNSFPSNYNDVDLCLKIKELGHNIAISGRARLYHFESKTRDAAVLPQETFELHSRWHSKFTQDLQASIKANRDWV